MNRQKIRIDLDEFLDAGGINKALKEYNRMTKGQHSPKKIYFFLKNGKLNIHRQNDKQYVLSMSWHSYMDTDKEWMRQIRMSISKYISESHHMNRMIDIGTAIGIRFRTY